MRPPARKPTRAAHGRRRVALLACLAALGQPALALEEPAGELEALKACEKDICTMILEKKPAGQDLACKLTKTWASETIKGGESQSVKWGFGDARCTTSVKLSRADVHAALTRPSHTIIVPNQTVRCEVERSGELKPLTAKASPRLEFRKGRAEKVWINLKEIEGPVDIKGTVWTAASLEDSIGIFHKSMIKQINKFMHKKCAENYGPGAAAAKAAKEQRRARAAAAKAKAAAAKAGANPAAKSSDTAPAPSGPATPAAAATPPAKTVAPPPAGPKPAGAAGP